VDPFLSLRSLTAHIEHTRIWSSSYCNFIESIPFYLPPNFVFHRKSHFDNTYKCIELVYYYESSLTHGGNSSQKYVFFGRHIINVSDAFERVKKAIKYATMIFRWCQTQTIQSIRLDCIHCVDWTPPWCLYQSIDCVLHRAMPVSSRWFLRVEQQYLELVAHRAVKDDRLWCLVVTILLHDQMRVVHWVSTLRWAWSLTSWSHSHIPLIGVALLLMAKNRCHEWFWNNCDRWENNNWLHLFENCTLARFASTWKIEYYINDRVLIMIEHLTATA
jgi:hypothetical protein